MNTLRVWFFVGLISFILIGATLSGQFHLGSIFNYTYGGALGFVSSHIWWKYFA